MKIFALAEDGSRRELQIEDVWPHKNWQVLKFAGVDSISDAEVLVGNELQVPASERAQLEPGAAYVSDLVGCMLFDRDREVGLVSDVRLGGGDVRLRVVGSGGKAPEVAFAAVVLMEGV